MADGRMMFVRLRIVIAVVRMSFNLQFITLDTRGENASKVDIYRALSIT